MLALVYLSLLAGLFALVFNLQTVLSWIRRGSNRLAHRSVSERRIGRMHKKVKRNRRLRGLAKADASR